MEHDEIYLIDLWRLLVREWRWFLALAIPLLAATAAFATMAKSQWEAEAWIQIGQVGSAPVGQDPKVESLLRTIERVKTVAFQDDVTSSLGFAHASPVAGLYRKSLRTEPEPYANLFRLFVRGYSADQARTLATATASRLRGIHERLGAVPLRQSRERLDEIQDELRRALADRERLLSEVEAGGREHGAAPLASALLAGRNEDIRTLEKERTEIVTRLAPNYTFETSMPWPVAVSDHRVFPNTVLIAGAGTLMAIFFGGLAAVLRNAIRRHSTKAAPVGTYLPIRP